MSRRRWLMALTVAGVAGALFSLRTLLLNSLLYFPSRVLEQTPAEAGLRYTDVAFETEDGERLHAWWIPTPKPSALAHVLHLHGNAGNISSRVDEAKLLAEAGLDVFLFDYRGYGRSTGSPDEEGTYRDARAARAALLRQKGVDPARVLYLGESLGGAVGLALALESPPRGLVLRSTFTSVKDMARLHYPIVPGFMVVDAYPGLARIARLRAPVLVIHGDRDDIVPLSHGEALFAAAAGPKAMRVFPGLGHNDLVALAGRAYAEAVASWAAGLPSPPPKGP